MLLTRQWSVVPSIVLALWLVSANENDGGGIIFEHWQHHSSPRPPYFTRLPTPRPLPTRPPPTDYPTPRPTPIRIQTCPTPDTILNFANAGLKRIGDAFVRSSEARKLYLNDNEITEISAMAFEELTRLEFLNLSGNNITMKKLLWFKRHLSLRNLIIDDNKYNTSKLTIDNIFQALPSLQELSLRRDNIFKLNVNLTDFAPRLQRLDLSGNKISSVDFLSDLPRTLSYFCLDDNAIANFADGTVNNVIELSISGNRIEELCVTSCQTNSLSLEGMQRLSKLNVSRNRISNVAMNAFLDAKQLTMLDLSTNLIRALPDGIFNGLVLLEKLYLAHNELTSLPKVCDLRRLQYLDISYNHITEVTSVNFCELQRLETLLLSNNHILNIDSDAFATLDMLQTLDLSSNLIDELPVNLIGRAKHLRILSLKNNSIHNIDQLLYRERPSSLKELHIEGNPFLYFKVRSMPDLTIHVKEQKLYDMDRDEMEQSVEKEDSKEENDVETPWSY